MNVEDVQKKAEEYRRTEAQLRERIVKVTQELQQLNMNHQQMVGAMKAAAEMMILGKDKKDKKEKVPK